MQNQKTIRLASSLAHMVPVPVSRMYLPGSGCNGSIAQEDRSSQPVSHSEVKTIQIQWWMGCSFQFRQLWRSYIKYFYGKCKICCKKGTEVKIYFDINVASATQFSSVWVGDKIGSQFGLLMEQTEKSSLVHVRNRGRCSKNRKCLV